MSLPLTRQKYNNMIINKKLTILASLLTFLSGTSQGEVYKWVDEQGQTHYAQQPPAATVPVEEIRTRSPQPASAATQGDNPVNKWDAIAKQKSERQSAEEEAQKKAQDDKTRMEHCKRTLEYIEMMQSKPQVSLKEGDNYIVLTEEQKQARLAELKEQYDKNCK